MVGVAKGFAGALLVFLGACAAQQPYVDVGSVVAEVREDEVATAAKYRNQLVHLHGRVADKGLKSGKGAETRGSVAFGVWSGKTQMVNKNYGYLVVESEKSSTSVAVCLFEPEMLDELAPVKKGSTVNLRCMFSMVVGKKPERSPVFYACAVDS